jgi:ATP-dependent RNA helicase DeaD
VGVTIAAANAHPEAEGARPPHESAEGVGFATGSAARNARGARGEGRLGSAPRGGEPRRGGAGVPHSAFATWEPPVDVDDDQPILVEGAGGEAGGEPARAPSGETPRGFARAPRGDAPDDAERGREDGDDAPEDEANFAQIFVNVGRRDGARPGDFHRLLVEGGGLDRRDAGRIRVRDRMTFVSVRKEAIERAIAALAGQIIGGRNVIAELAKPRSV